jgi:predicted transcriptional regulator
MYIESWKLMRCRIFERALEKASDAAGAVIISQVAMLGDLEGKPVNASKIADELMLPRSTVRAKFKLLVELGYIEKGKGSTYVVTERFKAMPRERAKKFRKIIERAYEDFLTGFASRAELVAKFATP